MKNWKIVLAILTANVIMMASGYTMLIPFLPVYLMKELGVSANDVKMWSGAIFSITFLIGGIMAPIWGKMADTRGKKLMAVRSGAGLALSYFLGGVVTSPEQMFAVRMLQGFAAGLWSVCLAICTSSVPFSKLGLSLGILQAGLTVGNVIGPLVGGTLATLFGMRISFFVAGGMLSFITLVFALYIPEPPKTAPKKESGSQLEENLLKKPGIMEALAYTSVVFMVILLIQPIISLYVAELHHSQENLVFLSGLVFSLMGIASAITAPMWGRMGQRKGFYRTMVMSGAVASVIFLACAIPETLTQFAVINFCCGLFFAGITPSLSAVLASLTAQHQRGRAFGYMFSAQQFGSMIGPLLGGALATYLPLRSLFVIGGIILMCVSAVVFMRHWKDAPPSETSL